MRLSEIFGVKSEIDSIISNNCKFAEQSKIELFRGMRGKPDEFVGTIRNDRKPRDSNQLLAYMFDAPMQILELPFRKSNTLSVTTNKDQTEAYGPRYMVYPFNDAKYLVSPRYKDFIYFSKDLLDRYIVLKFGIEVYSEEYFFTKNKLVTQFLQPDTELTNEIQAWLHDNVSFFKNIFYEIDDINDIKTKGEVLVMGTKYVAKKYMEE